MDWCYYLAVKILGMSEEEFLHSTPKKLFKLAEIHSKLNSPPEEEEKGQKKSSKKPKKNEAKYIDEIF